MGTSEETENGTNSEKKHRHKHKHKHKKKHGHSSTSGSNDMQMQEKLVDGDTPANSTDVATSAFQDDDDDREHWGKKVDFLLSVMGFCVDLANVWRFPYLCYKNGGGAFLIPYVLMLFLGGIPLFYMELALGQFHRKGAITCWGNICPVFKGIGYAVVLIAFYVDFFYNIIIAWALYYFVSSLTKQLPWTTCNNTWNTPNCYDYLLREEQPDPVTGIIPPPSAQPNISVANRTSPALEYFERNVLQIHESTGIEDIGTIRWQLALCLFTIYIVCYFSLWKGISTSGKVVWFTALFPYVVLLILLIRGVTLPGAMSGIQYYLTPNFERLKSSEVWVDAATQVFFSLGPGFGVLLAFASYNKFHNNVYADALATSTINCLTSFLSGFVIFSVLGYMAKKTGKRIEDVATEGPGLVFVVYPEAIATLPGSTFWAILFFMMLLTLGLDSSFGGSEAIITALSDEYPIIKNHREIFVGCLFTFYFLIGLPSCSQGGAYIVTLLDKYAAGYSILFAVFFETLAVSWFYGVDRFSDDIKAMLGFTPGKYWQLCWKYVAPVFIMCVMVFGFVMYQPLKYDDNYTYPAWANVVGWMIALSSMMCIPLMALGKFLTTHGTVKERAKLLITPWRDTRKRMVVENHEMTSQTANRTIGSNPLDAV